MKLLAFNYRTGSIEQYPVTIPAFAKDVAKCLIGMPSTGIYHVQLVDPMRGDLVLWESCDLAKASA